MAEIEALDLEAFTTKAINEVFTTMLSMEVEVYDVGAPEIISDGNRIVGSVSFAGEVLGSIYIHVSDTLARLMTGAMLGMKPEEIEGEEEVHDVIGEFSNMIGGNLKSHFSDSGFPCQLSIPSIMSGKDFRIEPMDWARNERFAFRHQQHIGLAEVYIKLGT
jgi:CheY-specific phosphatase CheX